MDLVTRPSQFMLNNNLNFQTKIWIYLLRGSNSSSITQVHVSYHHCKKYIKYSKSLWVYNKELINLQFPWMPNWIQKVNTIMPFVRGILKTYYLSTLGAYLCMPDHILQKWYDQFVASIDVYLHIKNQHKHSTLSLS